MEGNTSQNSVQVISLAAFKAQHNIDKLTVMQGSGRMYADLPNGTRMFFSQNIDLSKEIYVGAEVGAHGAYWAGNGKANKVATL